MAIQFVLLVVSHFTADGVVRDHVELVEINHFFDESGNLIFDQVIWWEWTGESYRVVDWRILQGVRCSSAPRRPAERPEFVGGHATPVFRHDRGRWVSRWFDQKTRRQREVFAIAFRETWTRQDPELRDREFLPVDQRRGLRR